MQRRAGFLVTALFFTALLGAGLLYDDLSAARRGGYENVRLLSEVVEQVSQKYVDRIDDDELYLRAIKGLVESLDPYSEFLTRDEYEDLKVHTSGNYEGLGISIDIRDDVLTVVAPIEGTPAYRAGIHSGDRIMAVDGRSTHGWSSERAVDELRGPAGSEVVLTIAREGLTEPIEITIRRQAIDIPSVPYAWLLDGGVGYVRFRQFSERGAREVQAAVENLRRQGMRSLVLDLRGNPGGLLDQAIDVTDLFLERGELVVSTRGRMPEQNRKYHAHDDVNYGTFPMIVLVDGGTASASEILAGALQDHDRALILGRTSFGKGLVQSLFPLEGNQAALKLTTARYYTPSGRNIQREESDDPLLAMVGDGDELPPVVEAAREEGEVPDSLVFHTDMGREVYGGGGITPDLVVSDTLTTAGRKLVEELRAKGVYFDYAVHYRAAHDKLPASWQPSEAEIEDFLEFARSKDILFAPEEFEAERDFIVDSLRSVMIAHYHGEAVARRQVMQADVALMTAVELLREGETLRDVFKLAEERDAAIEAALQPPGGAVER
ncbi:MAG TPA: S41 family peptidase [Gemmatimonadota bacterium]